LLLAACGSSLLATGGNTVIRAWAPANLHDRVVPDGFTLPPLTAPLTAEVWDCAEMIGHGNVSRDSCDAMRRAVAA
jgi:hypothetical protein